MNSPPGVPGPTCVRRSFSSFCSKRHPPRATAFLSAQAYSNLRNGAPVYSRHCNDLMGGWMANEVATNGKPAGASAPRWNSLYFDEWVRNEGQELLKGYVVDNV